METLCLIRDLYRSITEFESKFQQKYDLCLNEGMLLCSLRSEQHSSGEIAEILGLTNSNTSKVIRSVEQKGFIERILGKEDKRQMYFSLTSRGLERLRDIQCASFEMPDMLKNVVPPNR